MDYISRDQNPQFSQPLSQIITMLAIVAGVVGLGYLAYPSVGPTFLANPYLNIFILLVFVIGVATCFYQVLSLIYSVQWIEGFVEPVAMVLKRLSHRSFCCLWPAYCVVAARACSLVHLRHVRSWIPYLRGSMNNAN